MTIAVGVKNFDSFAYTFSSPTESRKSEDEISRLGIAIGLAYDHHVL